MATPSETEFIATSATAYPKGCMGCQRHKRDVMVSFTAEGRQHPLAIDKVFDLFLTAEQAVGLLDALTTAITRNQEDAE